MPYDYDPENIFARIVRGEIPNDTVLETDHSLAFNDIAPKAPVHVLVIPKGPYVNWDHFIAEAAPGEVLDFAKAIHGAVAAKGLEPGADGQGYRLIMNAGTAGVQEVPHLHVHILSGKVMGPMVCA